MRSKNSSSAQSDTARSPKHELIIRIVEFYDLKVSSVLGASKGYRNTSYPVLLTDGTLINLMLYKCEPKIDQTVARADDVSNFVAERGLPARHTLDNRAVCIRCADHDRLAKIYDYLPGNTIPWEAYTKGHIVSLGMTLSRLHAFLREYPITNIPSIETMYVQTITHMTEYFEQPGVRHAMTSKLGLTLQTSRLEQYKVLLEQCESLSGRQVLHMDFVRGNILFDGSKQDGTPVISGILDFEKVAIGHPLFDVARTLAFLLVDCKYKASPDVTKYFLESGYIKRGPTPLPKVKVKLNEQNHDLLALLLDLFLLHDFYKFLRHNPYESLAHNEHYMRTRAMLIHRNLIRENS